MTRIESNKPLSDAEVERLRAILESGRGGENCMTIEAVDGLFACLICSPEVVMPSQWMPVVWDGEGPEYESIEEANEIIGLLMRMWDEVARTINKGAYGPMVTVLECNDGVDRSLAADWALGFIEGMKFQEHYWLDTKDSDLMELLTPIVMLAKEGREGPDDGLLEDEVREDLIDMLPGIVIDLKNYWLEKVPPETLYRGGIGVPRGARLSAAQSRCRARPSPAATTHARAAAAKNTRSAADPQQWAELGMTRVTKRSSSE
jgi:uncharacterized protein